MSADETAAAVNAATKEKATAVSAATEEKAAAKEKATEEKATAVDAAAEGTHTGSSPPFKLIVRLRLPRPHLEATSVAFGGVI